MTEATKKIGLTRGQIKDEKLKKALDSKILTLNVQTGHLTWHARYTNGRRAGTPMSNGYRTVIIGFSPYLEHRIVFYLANGYLPRIIDHINGNRSDNRPINLREANERTNSFNTKRIASGRLTGTTHDKSKSKWRSFIKLNKKQTYLGTFNTEQEAHERYVQEYEKHFGKFNRELAKFRGES